VNEQGQFGIIDQTGKNEEMIKVVIQAHTNYLNNKDVLGYISIFEKPFETETQMKKIF